MGAGGRPAAAVLVVRLAPAAQHDRLEALAPTVGLARRAVVAPGVPAVLGLLVVPQVRVTAVGARVVPPVPDPLVGAGRGLAAKVLGELARTAVLEP